MTDAALTFTAFARDTATSPPRRHRAPVFIHDAVTPWGAETLLLALLHRENEDGAPDQPRAPL